MIHAIEKQKILLDKNILFFHETTYLIKHIRIFIFLETNILYYFFISY